jgi:hypothetical protein
MALNSRDPNSDGTADQAAHTYPITRAFALTVLAALILLIILRHVFGSLTVDVGTK